MKNLKFRVSIIVLVLTLLIGMIPKNCVRAVNQYNLEEVDSKIHTEIVGDVRIQVLSKTLVRLEVKGPKGFEDRETFHIVNRNNWLGDIVTKSEDDENVILETSTVKIFVKKGSKDLSGTIITDKDGNLLWKYTGMPGNKVSLPKTNEDVYAFAISDTPRIVPPEWGFNPQPDSNKEHRETNGWDLSNDSQDMYIFLPNNDHRQLRKDFVSLTGKTEMLPLSAFGAWDSRYYPYSDKTALEQIDGYHSRNLPLDVLVVDTDWRDASSGMGYDINTRLFPNMKEFFKKAHEKNVVIMFNDHPEPTKTNGLDNNVLVPKEIEYRSSNLKKLLSMGLDSWWYDRNWAKTVVPPVGFTHEVMGMAVYADAFKTVYPNRRLFIMSNIDGVMHGNDIGPSNIAAHRYSVQWTGDTYGGQETIIQEIINTVERGEISLLPYVSTDLGAHQTLSKDITDNEYIRWIQMGALSPIFRPHVMLNDTGRMPWLRGEAVTDIYRDYINLRYRLLPVFYQLAHENYETGMPITRAMTFDSPEYKGADRYDQYMLGEDILVAPVTESKIVGPVPKDWLSHDGMPGLKAEYYNNLDFSGEPVLTKIESTIDFDWGTGKPYNQVNADDFTVRYTGEITVKSSKNVVLEAYSDDGVRLYIDDKLAIDGWYPKAASSLFSTITLEAGKTYSIKLEYFEEKHDACLRLRYAYEDYKESKLSQERTVFIPEGEWINTINGETVVGPQTITIQCEIQDMPIFIKKGAVIPLADEMLTVKDKDWSHLTLDVYPSTRQSDRTIIYEDDTVSTDYEKGLYRTTDLRTGFVDGKATLNIGAANGTFRGERAFQDRSWTIRVHRPEGWGKLKNVTLNGKNVEFEEIEKDPNAMPLTNKGGATDGDVYVIKFKSNVYKAQNLVFEFENAIDPEIPEGNYEKPVYGKSYKAVADDTVIRVVKVADEVTESVDLTKEGTSDWYLASYDGNAVRKANGRSKIQVQLPEANIFNDYHTKFSWSDGDNGEPVSNLTSGLYNVNTNTSFDITVKASPIHQELNLYIGLWNATGSLEIYDDSNNSIVDKLDFISTNSKSEYIKVTINMTSETISNLHIRYTLTSKSEPGSNITFVAATLKSIEDDIRPEVNKTIIESEVPEAVNLSDANSDWIYAGEKDNGVLSRKANVKPQIMFTRPAKIGYFYDYNTKISWNDGDKDLPECNGTTNGINHANINDAFEITVPSDEVERELTLYLTGWQSESKLEVFDEADNSKVETFIIGNNDTTYPRKFTIKYSSPTPTTLHVRYTLTSKTHPGANSAFVAATLNYLGEQNTDPGDEVDDITIKTGYREGMWTSKTEKVLLSSSFGENTEFFVKINDGDAIRISGDLYKIDKDGINKYDFYAKNQSGTESSIKSLTIRKDSLIPELNIDIKLEEGNVIFTPTVTSDNISPVNIYCRKDGGLWVPVDGKVTVPENNNSIYRFAVVSDAGLISDIFAYINGELTGDPDLDPVDEPGSTPSDDDNNNNDDDNKTSKPDEQDETPKTGYRPLFPWFVNAFIAATIIVLLILDKNKKKSII